MLQLQMKTKIHFPASQLAGLILCNVITVAKINSQWVSVEISYNHTQFKDNVFELDLDDLTICQSIPSCDPTIKAFYCRIEHFGDVEIVLSDPLFPQHFRTAITEI